MEGDLVFQSELPRRCFATSDQFSIGLDEVCTHPLSLMCRAKGAYEIPTISGASAEDANGINGVSCDRRSDVLSDSEETLFQRLRFVIQTVPLFPVFRATAIDHHAPDARVEPPRT
jgi:hypothetical protein